MNWSVRGSSKFCKHELPWISKIEIYHSTQTFFTNIQNKVTEKIVMKGFFMKKKQIKLLLTCLTCSTSLFLLIRLFSFKKYAEVCLALNFVQNDSIVLVQYYFFKYKSLHSWRKRNWQLCNIFLFPEFITIFSYYIKLYGISIPFYNNYVFVRFVTIDAELPKFSSSISKLEKGRSVKGSKSM